MAPPKTAVRACRRTRFPVEMTGRSIPVRAPVLPARTVLRSASAHGSPADCPASTSSLALSGDNKSTMTSVRRSKSCTRMSRTRGPRGSDRTSGLPNRSTKRSQWWGECAPTSNDPSRHLPDTPGRRAEVRFPRLDPSVHDVLLAAKLMEEANFMHGVIDHLRSTCGRAPQHGLHQKGSPHARFVIELLSRNGERRTLEGVRPGASIRSLRTR